MVIEDSDSDFDASPVKKKPVAKKKGADVGKEKATAAMAKTAAVKKAPFKKKVDKADENKENRGDGEIFPPLFSRDLLQMIQ